MKRPVDAVTEGIGGLLGECLVQIPEVPLECTYDFEVAAAKYLHALRDGGIPL